MDNVKENEGRSALVRRSLATAGTTGALVLGGASAALATPTPPDPGTVAGDLANTAGTQMLDAVIDVLPVLVPFLVALWALGFVWKKVRPKGGGIR